MQILIVEDHADTAAAFAFVLRLHGHAVVVAHRVAEALTAFDAGPFDVVLCDLMLPDGNGWDLMRTFTARRPTRGIAVSACAFPADKQRSHDAGFERHLSKPVCFDELVGVIESRRPRLAA